MSIKVIVAKSAGFCFGVDRAVLRAFEEAAKERDNRIVTLGPLIHNPDVVVRLSQKGVGTIKSPENARAGDTVIIRTHGVPEASCVRLREKGATVIDVTCPYVAKIHKIVKNASDKGDTVIIFGHHEHPEVLGVRGHCKRSVVFSSIEELMAISADPKLSDSSVTMVSQTTMNSSQWVKCCDYAKKTYTKIFISDTICNATDERQREAATLASNCDAMIVIGGRDSSNTRRLYEVCSACCSKTSFVESADEINLRDYSSLKTVGVTAGASTPANIIKAVCEKFS